jgi:site-specific DNA-methyltransferase (adenine-specific)
LPYGVLTNQPLKDGTAGESKGGKHYSSKPSDGGVATKRREVGEGGMFGCSWDIKIDLVAFWIQVERLMKDDHTPIIHFCNAKFGNDLINSKEKWFRYDLIWNKSNGVGFLSANKMPLRSHELIYVFSKKGANYNRIDIEGDYPASHYSNHKTSDTSNVVPRVKDLGTIAGNVYDCGSDNRTTPIVRVPVREGIRCVLSVIQIANKKGKGRHPTQKPADLYEWLIARYSNEGDTILDPTAGSFTSCFKAKEMGRNAIGMEMNKEFYDKANNLKT